MEEYNIYKQISNPSSSLKRFKINNIKQNEYESENFTLKDNFIVKNNHKKANYNLSKLNSRKPSSTSFGKLIDNMYSPSMSETNSPYEFSSNMNSMKIAGLKTDWNEKLKNHKRSVDKKSPSIITIQNNNINSLSIEMIDIKPFKIINNDYNKINNNKDINIIQDFKQEDKLILTKNGIREKDILLQELILKNINSFEKINHSKDEFDWFLSSSMIVDKTCKCILTDLNRKYKEISITQKNEFFHIKEIDFTNRHTKELLNYYFIKLNIKLYLFEMKSTNKTLAIVKKKKYGEYLITTNCSLIDYIISDISDKNITKELKNSIEAISIMYKILNTKEPQDYQNINVIHNWKIKKHVSSKKYLLIDTICNNTIIADIFIKVPSLLFNFKRNKVTQYLKVYNKEGNIDFNFIDQRSLENDDNIGNFFIYIF
jgi:hypothetical protein